MNYEIKLYAHGVPRGQGTWGVGDFDVNYIETFYGRKSNVPVQMIVEVRQFNSSTFCYYTYLRIDNICDKTGRTGSYFALTLRINYYYADIQNIYNLLDAAYNKFIVGSIVGVNGGVTKYLVTDFSQADTTLKSLEQELNKYLMQFSSDSDFIPLSGFSVKGQCEPVTINLLECDSKIIVSHVKNNGSISVSPLHPSVRVQQIIQEMTEKVNAANAQAQKQISEVQQNAQRDVNAARDQAQQDVAAAMRDKEAGIMAIRKEYKDADKTISSLRKEIDKANKEIASLCESKKELNQKLQKVEVYKNKYDEAKKDLDNKNECLVKIGEVYSELRAILEVKGKNTRPYEDEDRRSEKPQREEKSLSWVEIMRRLHPFTSFVFQGAIILLLIIIIFLPNSCSDKNTTYTEGGVSDSDVSLRSDVSKTSNNSIDGFQTIVQEFRPSLKEILSRIEIDIVGINPRKMMKYEKGKSYMVSLKVVEEGLDGKWVSNDFDISDNHITPKESGQCTISYVVGNDTLVTRTINVK